MGYSGGSQRGALKNSIFFKKIELFFDFFPKMFFQFFLNFLKKHLLIFFCQNGFFFQDLFSNEHEKCATL